MKLTDCVVLPDPVSPTITIIWLVENFGSHQNQVSHQKIERKRDPKHVLSERSGTNGMLKAPVHNHGKSCAPACDEAFQITG